MHSPKILVVDDDAIVRTLLRHTLGNEPYTLLETGDGNHALEIANQELPDLILLDVMMPGLDGLDVLRQLQQQEHTRKIPVIMITALNQDLQISSCLDAGAVDHIIKPFSPVVVQARVRAALRAAQHSRAAASPNAQGSKRGKLIGFIGAKGGVGVTTVAVNTALTLLTSSDQSVIVAELRPCLGTAAHQLGLKPVLNLKPLLDYEDPADINAETVGNCLTPHPYGLRLLLAPPTMDDRREITAQQATSIVKTLTEMADCVIIDFPCLPSKATTAALRCCDYVVLTIELETTSLAAAQAMLEGLSYWGVDERSIGAVLVPHHQSANLSITMSFARTQLKCPIISVIPADGGQYLAAFKTGTPLVLSQSDGATVFAFHELANRLMQDTVPALIG